jgi:glucose/arabinose dehydrogenase
MDTKTERKIVIGLIILLLAVGGFYFWRMYNGLKPAILPPEQPTEDQTETGTPPASPDTPTQPDNDTAPERDEPSEITSINETPYPLEIPNGFKATILTDNIPEARVMRIGPLGDLWVSQTREGKISLVELGPENRGDTQAILQDLNNPHGLAFHPQDEFQLYYAEEGKISRINVYSDGEPDVIYDDLPTGGRHFTRTIGFGPDGRLYVSIGSSCDTCVEDDDRRAAIYSMNPDGSDFKSHAQGLRNAVFFTWNYVDGSMWATEMGRDHLGDNTPPDEIVKVEEGNHYGWPYCYGKNTHDAEFDDSQEAKEFCQNEATPSTIDLQAHSAPLGLGFVPEEGWPEDMWYDMIVAYHGSWNRTVPTGYKLMRFKFDAEGNFQGREDFIAGWLADSGRSYGRPVDVLIQPGGVMYVSDDKAGNIYRITRIADEQQQAVYETEDLRLYAPDPAEPLSGNVEIRGETPGTMFFEGDFPVRLEDDAGNVLATSIATAQDEWMTEDFVTFTSEISFTKPETNSGALVFIKDNPSGLPENDKEIRVPVTFE